MEKKKMPLPKLDDLFLEHDGDKPIEKIIDINIDEIDEFKNHPFKIIENSEFLLLVESIKENGVILPAIVRLKENGRYEMVSGHRRKRASEIAELKTIPCVVKDLTDDEATIVMVDSNLHREKLLPSEKAFAYKMKSDALSHRGIKTSRPLDAKLYTPDLIGKENGDSARHVQRYIRLTYLIPELLNMVDNDVLNMEPRMGFRPSVEISYLKEEEQMILLDTIQYYEATPSLSQALELKRLSSIGKLNDETVDEILSKEKPNQVQKVNIPREKIQNVLPKELKSEKEVQNYIINAVIDFSRRHREKISIER